MSRQLKLQTVIDRTPSKPITHICGAWTWPTYLTQSYRGGWLQFRSHRDEGERVEAWFDHEKLGTWKSEVSARRAIRLAINRRGANLRSPTEANRRGRP